MNWADQHGVSYLAWGWEVLSAQEISDQGCSAFYLTRNAGGTPAPPNGTAVHDHLVNTARQEWLHFNRAVTDWERRRNFDQW